MKNTKTKTVVLLIELYEYTADFLKKRTTAVSHTDVFFLILMGNKILYLV